MVRRTPKRNVVRSSRARGAKKEGTSRWARPFFIDPWYRQNTTPLAIHRDQGVTYDSESLPCLNLILSTDLRLLRKTIFGWDRPRGYSCLETLFCACHPLAILRGWGLNAAFSHL